MRMNTTTIDDELSAILDGNMSMPDQVQAAADASSHISVQRIVSAIKAMATLAADLDHSPKMEMLQTLVPLIAKFPADERGPFETAIGAILKNGADTDKFMQSIPVPAATGPKFKPHTMRELIARPKKQWLIDTVIGAGDKVMVYGASGCGKTHVVIDLIFASCMGVPFARRFTTARRLNVAYAAGEGISGLAQRFAAVMDHYSYHDPLFDYPNFTFFDVVPQLYVGGDALGSEIAQIGDFIREWKERQAKGEAQPLDILVIDTLHTATVGADENGAKDMGIVLACVQKAIKELGCAVIVVHHTGKNGESERGSSTLRGAMDTMIHIAKLSDNGTKAVMRCAKSKDSEAWKEQTFDLTTHLDSVRVWWDEPSDGSEADDKRKSETAKEILDVLSSAKAGLTAKQISEAIDAKQQAANNVLKRLEKEELVTRSQNSRGTWCFAITDRGKAALQDKILV
jgi:predicted transcriptional regulator